MRIRLLVLVTILTSSGCASVSTMGLARTLNGRALQGWVAPSGAGVVSLARNAPPGVGYPLVEGGVRYGITDHFELGARVGFNGVGLEGKGALLRSPTMDSGVNVSINPGAMFITTGILDALSFSLPVLIGIDFSGHELIIGPRVIDQLFLNGVTGAAGGLVNVLYAGGSLGIALRISPSFRMLPEVAIAVPIFGSVPGAAASSTLGGGLIFQVGVGFLLGTENQYDLPQAAPMGPPPPPLPPPDPAPAPIMPPPPAPQS